MMRSLLSFVLLSSVGCGAASHELGEPDANPTSDALPKDASGLDAGAPDVEGYDASPRPDAGSVPDSGVMVTVAGVQQAAFRGCVGEGCHFCMVLLPDAGCAWQDRPLSLYGSPDQVVRSLVNVQAISSPSKVRVKPFDPDNSFIVQKLEGHLAPGEGSQMPLGRAGIPQSDIDVLRAWIAQGAPAN